jgi:Fe-S cluster assembly protein SufD
VGAFEAMALPTEKEEVWRYSPIDQLNLASFRPVLGAAEEGAGSLDALGPLGSAFVIDALRDLGQSSAAVIVHNGSPLSFVTSELPEGVEVAGLGDAARGQELLGAVMVGGDAFVRLNDAFAPDAVIVDVPAAVHLSDPIVVVHWCDGSSKADGTDQAPASFPRTVIRLGRGAEAQVIEVMAGAPGGTDALIVPVVELNVEEAANLSYVSIQVLGDGAWHIGRLAGRVERDATVRTFTVGLGGSYDRSRTDVAVVGSGATSQLRSAYLGTGDQIHDIRTQQDHAAPRTDSDLLCKGAVAGHSRSIYTGLIRVRHGAVKTDARQTNHNLVLNESAHADSVPNLDIEENDVRCSHASTVGPVDEDQRYYLESRGVPPEEAERLIVLGFFDDIIERSPITQVVERLRREVGLRLAVALGAGQIDDGGDEHG